MLSYLCDRCGTPIASHEDMVTVRDRYRSHNFHREPCGAAVLTALEALRASIASVRERVR